MLKYLSLGLTFIALVMTLDHIFCSVFPIMSPHRKDVKSFDSQEVEHKRLREYHSNKGCLWEFILFILLLVVIAIWS